MRKHIVTWRKHEFFIFPSTSSYLNVHGNTRSRSGNTFFSCFRRRNQTERRRKYWVTFRKQIFVLFLLTNSDLEWTETLDFVPETLFFLFPLFIGLFQHSLFVIFLFHYRTGKYVLIVRFYITPTRLLYRPFVKSMLRTMYNHTYTRTIFSLQLQSIYFILLLFFNRSTGDNFYYMKSTYIFARRPCHLNITYLKFLT